MSEVYKALIIGAGNIAALFDNPDTEQVLTHAHAFVKHPGFDLRGFVDTDFNKAQIAANTWGGKAFSSVAEAFAAEEFDVVSVTVPDEYHFAILKEVAQYPIQLVLAEKPLAKTLEQAGEIREIYKQKNTPVIVNYSRRFVPEFQLIRDEILRGDYGKLLSGFGIYGKGILHNGSHFIDLLRFFFGEVEAWQVTRRIDDVLPNDPTVAAMLTIKESGIIYLDCVDSRDYTIFELDLLFSKKRIRMINSGFSFEEYDVRENPMFAGYRNMHKSKELATSINRSLEYTIQNVYDVLSYGAEAVCTIDDAFRAMQICLAIGEDAV